MAFLASAAAAPLLNLATSLVGALFGGGGGGRQQQPQPERAPKTPVSISNTAARERSRTARRSPNPTSATVSVGALGNNGGITRPTLLGI